MTTNYRKSMISVLFKVLMMTILPVLLIGKESNNSEVIGIPILNFEQGVGLVDSAVLAPNAESFYTLKEDLVTHWQLTPLKRLSSFRTNIKFHTNKRNDYQISTSTDNKRIILYSDKEIQLWDVKTKKHLNTVPIKELLFSLQRSKYGFLTMDKENILCIWNDENLTLKKSISFDKFVVPKSFFEYYDSRPFNMLNGSNILITNYLEGVLFFNLDTFELLHQFNRNNNSQLLDLKYIAEQYSGKFKNSYLYHKYIKQINELKLPKLETVSFFKKSTNFTNELILLNTFDKYQFVKVFLSKSGKLKKHLYSFYQLDDAAVLIKKSFMGSGDFKKYLKMRKKNGEIAPINNATFKKYNKVINLKD